MDIENADGATLLAYNNFYGASGDGIYLVNASFRLEHNTVNGSSHGIYCDHFSNATISNNTITNCTDGIHSRWSNATIVNNVIKFCSGWGIYSEFMAPANSGANGSGLKSSNTISNCSLGWVTQVWHFQVFVWNDTANQSASYQWVRIADCNNNTVWEGYTDGQGYTEIIVVPQYTIINSTATILYNQYRVYTTPASYTNYTVVSNYLAIVHIS